MITDSDSYSTYDLGKYYVILPQIPAWEITEFCKVFNAVKVAKGFKYNSGTNSEWLSINDLRHLIREHINPHFDY